MKEGPTILMIIKDRFGEPTMFMKTPQMSGVTHDLDDNKGDSFHPRIALRIAALTACRVERSDAIGPTP